MKMLKSILLVALTLAGLNVANGQDLMLKLSPKTKVITFNDLSIKNQSISITNTSDGITYTFPFNSVNKIVFNGDKTNEVHLTIFEIDSIACEIKSIGRKSVLYSLPNSSIMEIRKENVLGILFNNDQYSYVINNFKDKFLSNHSIIRNEDYRLISRDGIEYIIYNISLNSKEFTFEI
jgi:hypothetical protein